MSTTRKPYLFLFTLFHIFFLFRAWPQDAVSDTALYRAAVDNIIRLYTDSVKENLRLYSGTEFTGGYRRSAGHPFFEYAEPQRGDVFYEETRYPAVLLAYDLTRDELIFVNPVNKLNIKLITQKVEGFNLAGHLFVHIRPQKNTNNFPGEGFYELLYEGPISVLARRKKELRESAKAEERSRFVQTNDYYIRKDSSYYLVGNKRSLLAVCQEHKAEIAKYMQKEKLSFKKDPENTIIKLIDYCNQLSR